MGAQEGIVVLTSWTSGQSGSTTNAQHLQVRASVMAEELLHAPLADPVADEMTFWAVCPTFGTAEEELLSRLDETTRRRFSPPTPASAPT